MTILKLQSCDGKFHDVDLHAALKASVVIREMWESDFGESEDKKENIIQLPNVNGPILKKIVAWITHHKDDPPQAAEPAVEISTWEAEFWRVDKKTMFELLTATYNLDIKDMLAAGCRIMANMIRDRRAQAAAEEEVEVPGQIQWCRYL